jgi:hypothetical protein
MSTKARYLCCLYSLDYLERLSGKSLGGLWSESIGGATLQKQVLCAPV